MGHLSPISSDSPSPVNLHTTEEKLQALAAAAAASKPKPVETKPPVTDKPVAQAKSVAAKSVAATSVKSTKPDSIDKGNKQQATSSKPVSRVKERHSRSRSSSSGSTSSFSSSSASSFSSKSSSSQRHKKRRHSSSSSSSSRSSSSLSSSSSSSSSSRSHRSSSGSSSSGSGSRKHKHRSRKRLSKERQSHRRHSTDRDHDKNHSRKRHDDRNNDNEGDRHFGRGSRFVSQRGRGRGDFNRPGGFQRDRNYSEGGRPQRFNQHEPQDFRREVRIQRPFNRPSFGRGRQGFRPSFNPPQFRSVFVRSRGRDRDFRDQQQRPIGGRYNRPDFQSDNRQPSDRYSNKRHRDDDSPEHDRQRRRVHSESSDHHRSSRMEQRGPRSNYESKIGAPIKESRDPVEHRTRSYSDSNHSRHSDNKLSPRHPKSPVKSTSSRKSDDEIMEPELELQPESDLELEPSRMEIDALLEHPISEHTDTKASNKRRYVCYRWSKCIITA